MSGSVFAGSDTEQLANALGENAITAWVQLFKDGTMTIYSPAMEMDQGSMSALPITFAEEMDADWDKVTVEFAPQDASVYGRKLHRGVSQMTFGSTGVMTYYPLLRQAGGQARYILLASVAKHWGVDIKELSTGPNKVIHASSSRELDYGEVVSFLEIPNTIPTIPDDKLNDPQNFRLIGKNIPRYDIPHKANGSAQFSIDVRLPDMLYGMVEKGRVHGAKPISLKNESEIKAMGGIFGVYPLEHGIGIVAKSMGQVFPAKHKLDIEWGTSEATGFNSADVFDIYEKVLQAHDGEGKLLVNLEDRKAGKVLIDDGDVHAAKDSAAKQYLFDYKNDYIYHAQQEPLNSVLQVTADGTAAEVWIGTQALEHSMTLPKHLA